MLTLILTLQTLPPAVYRTPSYPRGVADVMKLLTLPCLVPCYRTQIHVLWLALWLTLCLLSWLLFWRCLRCRISCPTLCCRVSCSGYCSGVVSVAVSLALPTGHTSTHALWLALSTAHWLSIYLSADLHLLPPPPPRCPSPASHQPQHQPLIV